MKKILFFAICATILVIGWEIASLLSSLNIKIIVFAICATLFIGIALFLKLLYKVRPKRATLIEISLRNVRRITLGAGLYLLIEIKPFIEIKLDNCSLAIVSIEPIAGIEEDWSGDWQNGKKRHPDIKTFTEKMWETFPKIEFEDGSNGLIEFILMLQVVDLDKYAYASTNPIPTIVAYTKLLLKDAYTKMSFAEARKDFEDGNTTSEELQRNILTAVAALAKDFGIEVIIPENGKLVKMFYPSPATERARAKIFDAKASGKAKVEEATGDADAAVKHGEGQRAQWKAAAEIDGISIRDILAFEQQKVAAGAVTKSTTILSVGKDGMAGAVAGLAGVATTVQKSVNSSSTPTAQDDTNNSGE